MFDPAMHERAPNRLSLENDLRHAIGNDEFHLLKELRSLGVKAG